MTLDQLEDEQVRDAESLYDVQEVFDILDETVWGSSLVTFYNAQYDAIKFSDGDASDYLNDVGVDANAIASGDFSSLAFPLVRADVLEALELLFQERHDELVNEQELEDEDEDDDEDGDEE